MRIAAFLAAGVLAMTASSVRADNDPRAALGHEMPSIDGQTVKLEEFQGKVALVVNVASKCGLTPQYEGLQAIYDKYQEEGLVVLGFPCNQFGGQEPGTEAEIKQFCSTKYSVTFPMFAKVDVNGEKAAPLYKQLTSLELPPVGSGDISWNFEKFLIDREGKVIARFSPRTKPDDPELVAAIERALKKN